MNHLSRTLLGLPLAGVLFFVACGDDTDPGTQTPVGGAANSSHGGEGQGGEAHGEGPAACEALGSLCHDADEGPGPVGTCHDVGHAADEKECKAQFASCITVCVAEESSAGGAPPETVTNPYCQALGELCHFLNDEGTPTGECHEVGHVGNEPDCVKAFEGCVPLCLAKRETEPTGHDEAGGAGGQASAHEEPGDHGGAGGLGGAAGAGG
jgi:hypothetical protein